VSLVGVRSDHHLGEEPGEEPDSDHHAERRLRDAVLVADVVEHREEHAVSSGEACPDEPARDDEGADRIPVSRLVHAPSLRHDGPDRAVEITERDQISHDDGSEWHHPVGNRNGRGGG
jgi:hypothetical protein